MIIGISGHAHHGKDTAADAIVARLGYEKRPFAGPMKEACRLIFGWTDAHLYGDLKETVDPRWGISPRHALQSLGTEWGQFGLSKFDEFAEKTGRRLWADSLLSTCGRDTVIPDVRFQHEVDAIHERGGIVILVRRPGEPVDLSHESERSIEELVPDFVIRNAGPISWLQDEVVALVSEVSK